MKVKKYPQSHLVITGESTKIMIDPGYITFEKGFKVEEFQGMDGYLITHQHADHMDANNIKSIVNGKMVYGNFDVVAKLKILGVEAITVYDKQPFRVGEFEITPYDLAHFTLTDGSFGPPNTGYLIDGIFFHPGDGDKAIEGLNSKNLALVVANPHISPGHYEDALEFAKQMKSDLVIPIHYDSRYPVDLKEFSQKAKEVGLEVKVLSFGEEAILR